MTQAQRDTKRQLMVLEYAEKIGNISKACRQLDVTRSRCLVIIIQVDVK